MAREKHDVEVDNVYYTICPLPPTKSTLVFLELVKVFGPALGLLIKGSGNVTVEQVKQDAKALENIPIEDMILAIADRIDPEQIMQMARKLLAGSHPKDKPAMLLGNEAMFDAHFDSIPGGLFHIGKLLKEVLQLNYADLFIGKGIHVNTQEPQKAVNIPYQMVP